MKVDNLLNSPLVNKLLRFGLSKFGMAINTLATQLAAHAVIWLGLGNILDPESLKQVQGGFEAAAIAFGGSMQATLYAWLIDRQKRGVAVMQAAVTLSNVTPVELENHGIAGNNTVAAVSEALDVDVRKAIRSSDAGVVKPESAVEP